MQNKPLNLTQATVSDYWKIFIDGLPIKAILLRKYSQRLKDRIGENAYFNVFAFLSIHSAIVKATFNSRSKSDIKKIYELANNVTFNVVLMDEIIEKGVSDEEVDELVSELVSQTLPGDSVLQALYSDVAHAMLMENKFEEEGFQNVSFQEYLNTVLITNGALNIFYIISVFLGETDAFFKFKDVIKVVDKAIRFKSDAVKLYKDMERNKGNVILMWMRENGYDDPEEAKKAFLEQFLKPEVEQFERFVESFEGDVPLLIRFVFNYLRNAIILFDSLGGVYTLKYKSNNSSKKDIA